MNAIATKVKAVKITIDRAEGMHHECIKTEHTTWAEAEQRILDIRSTAPADGGYDKCDFKIEFEDGQTYEGRYDAQHTSITDEVGLAGHVRSHLEFLSGDRCPAHMTKDEYDRAMAVREHRIPGIREEAKTFLANYSLED